MRLLIQRVSEARVSLGGEICGMIKNGLLVFLGIHKEDTEQEIPLKKSIASKQDALEPKWKCF